PGTTPLRPAPLTRPASAQCCGAASKRQEQNNSVVCLDRSPRRISRLMRAVVITSPGGVEGIGVQEVETPLAPTADRVRVRVHAAGLNRADILQRRGHYPAPSGYSPNIPCMEFSGGVESIGDAVRAWKVGDGVFGIIGDAALA